jgi:ABC-2 type transport system permease protein
MRGYVRTALMAAGEVTESPLFIADYALRLLRVIVLLTLWRTVLGSSTQDDVAMSLGSVLTYTVVAELFAPQLATRTTLTMAFWQGTIVVRFLRPMGLVRQFTAEAAGQWLVHFVCFSVPLLMLAPVLGVDPRPASLVHGVCFVLSLGLAISVGLALEFLFATLTVVLDQPVWTIEWVRTAIATLLSGSLLPLALYPWGVGAVFGWLPFAAMAWAPLAIFTGAGDPLSLLLTQAGWSIVLWPVSRWLWNAHRETVVGYGG